MNKTQFKPSEWKGSLKTYDKVRQEIANRWGEEEADKYNPLANCFTAPTWHSKGYYIKKGEHAIKSSTVLEKEEVEGEEVHVKQIPRAVNLFYIKQVEK